VTTYMIQMPQGLLAEDRQVKLREAVKTAHAFITGAIWMSTRISITIHAYLIDYPVAVILLVAPFVLKLGPSGSVAMWLSVITGVAALLLPLLTDHPTGLIKIIPYSVHLWVDRAVGIVFLAALFVFGFSGIAAWYYGVLGVAVLLTTSVFNAPGQPASLQNGMGTRDAI
jgi:hypothetical protein